MTSKTLIIDALTERGLTEGFYSSLLDQYKEKGFLSQKQRNLLRQSIKRYDEFYDKYFELNSTIIPKTGPMAKFVNSVRDQYIRKGELTEKQENSLEKIGKFKPNLDDDYYI